MKNYKKLIKVVVSFITSLLFLMTLFFILIGIKANIDGSPARILGYSYSVVVTDSMEDTIHVGDFIIYKNYNFEEIKENDIIVFYSELIDRYVVHRVVEVNQDSLITKGDNPLASVDSSPVTEENFYGKVVTYGSFMNFGLIVTKYRNVAYLLIALIFIAIIIFEIISIVKQSNLKKEDELKNNIENEKNKILEIEKEKIRQEILLEMKNRGDKH